MLRSIDPIFGSGIPQARIVRERVRNSSVACYLRGLMNRNTPGLAIAPTCWRETIWLIRVPAIAFEPIHRESDK